MSKAQTKKTLSFEEALKRLDEIKSELENGMVSLNETVKLYTEGRELYEFCLSELEKAQLTVKNIMTNNKNIILTSKSDLEDLYNKSKIN